MKINLQPGEEMIWATKILKNYIVGGVAEKVANLLYFVIKDRPFLTGIGELRCGRWRGLFVTGAL